MTDKTYAGISTELPLSKVWQESATGVIILENYLPGSLIDSYIALRSKLGPRGWADIGAPYQFYRELMDLCLYPSSFMAAAFGVPMGVHLNLTDWVSTERDWHSDQYLNPQSVGDKYIAAWFALEDIDPKSGPFQYIPGSHLWPVITRDKVFDNISAEEAASPDWP